MSPLSNNKRKLPITNYENKPSSIASKKQKVCILVNQPDESENAYRLLEAGVREMQAAGGHVVAETHFLDALGRIEAQEMQIWLHSRNLNEKSSAINRCRSCKSGSGFDEGLHFYSDPILTAAPTDTTSSSAALVQVLLFNIALTHIVRGNIQASKSFLEQSLLYGEIPDTEFQVQLYQNIGYCQYRLGQDIHALESYRKALFLAEASNLSVYHVATAKNSIAVLLFRTDPASYDMALALFLDCLVLYSALYGAESKQAATVLYNMGRILHRKGKIDGAQVVVERALQIRRTIHDEDDAVNLAATVCIMGQLYQAKGQLDEAKDFYQEFLVIAGRSQHIRVSDRLGILKCLGDIHNQQKNFDDAKATYQSAIEMLTTCGRVDTTAERMGLFDKLGVNATQAGNLQEALKFLEQGLSLGQNEPLARFPTLIVQIMRNIAAVHRKVGNFSLACAVYKKTHSFQVVLYGEESLQAASSLAAMGLMELLQKKYSIALEIFQKVLVIQRGHFKDNDSIEISSTLSSIGLSLFHQKSLKLANICFLEALRIRRKLQGPNHRDVAALLYNLSSVNWEFGDEDRALKMHEEALRIEQATLGCEHPESIRTLQHLGVVHQKLGRYEDAFKCFTEALGFHEKTKNLSRTDSTFEQTRAKILQQIANVSLQLGDIDHVMKCCTLATRIQQNQTTDDESSLEQIEVKGIQLYFLNKFYPPGAPAA